MKPGKPRRMTHQSKPGVRRRRLSQPSIHLPRSVYLPSIKTGVEDFKRFSFGAKKSSLANRTAPPRRSAARSTSSVKSIRVLATKRHKKHKKRRCSAVPRKNILFDLQFWSTEIN